MTDIFRRTFRPGAFPCLLAVLSLAIFLAVRPAAAFPVPEKLVFDLTWTGIKAGTAVQETVRDKGVVRITSTARSTDWISTFFKVEDRIESTLPLQGDVPGLPQRFVMKIREGSHRRDREIVFDRQKKTALSVDNLSGKRKTLEITDTTYDSLSCFYAVRSMPLEPGKSVFIDILDHKRLWKTEVKVLRREKIRTSLGEFNTIVLKPVMQSEGIFNKQGDMFIWLTDDAARIPVKMQTKVKIGSIVATLVGGHFRR